MFEIASDRRTLLLAAAATALPAGATAQTAVQRPGLRVIAEITAKPEHADDIRQALISFATSARSEPGCIHYDLYEDASQPGHFFTEEIWTDGAALDAHLNSPAMKAAGPKFAALLAAPPAINRLKPLNVS